MLHSGALFLAKNTEQGFPPRSLPLAGARLHCVPRWIASRSIQIVLQLLKTRSTLPIYKFTYMHEQAYLRLKAFFPIFDFSPLNLLLITVFRTAKAILLNLYLESLTCAHVRDNSNNGLKTCVYTHVVPNLKNDLQSN